MNVTMTISLMHTAAPRDNLPRVCVADPSRLPVGSGRSLESCNLGQRGGNELVSSTVLGPRVGVDHFDPVPQPVPDDTFDLDCHRFPLGGLVSA